MVRILIVSLYQAIGSARKLLLHGEGVECTVVSTLAEARTLLGKQSYAVVIADLEADDRGGMSLEFFRAVSSIPQRPVRVMIYYREHHDQAHGAFTEGHVDAVILSTEVRAQLRETVARLLTERRAVAT